MIFSLYFFLQPSAICSFFWKRMGTISTSLLIVNHCLFMISNYSNGTFLQYGCVDYLFWRYFVYMIRINYRVTQKELNHYT